MVGRASLSVEKNTRLTWLVNSDFGGSIPSVFAISILSGMMAYPVRVVETAKQLKLGVTESVATGDREKGNEADPFVANMPKNLTLENCLVDKGKYSTLEDQRAHFRERMLGMASEIENEANGWTLLGKTQMEGLSPEQQLDVYEKKVEWSEVNQLRSVVETDLSCDHIFDYLLNDFQRVGLYKPFHERISEDEAR